MRKDICGYFYSFSKCSASSIAASSKDVSNSESEDSDEEPVTKTHVTVQLQRIVTSEINQYWELIRCHLYFHFIANMQWEEPRGPMN